MNIYLIKYLIDKKIISKATGRLLETAFICGATYLLGCIIQGDMVNLNALLVAVITPFYLYYSKKKRDG